MPEDDPTEENEEQMLIRRKSEEIYDSNRLVLPFDEYEVGTILNNLKKSKTPGPDGIYNEMLKILSASLIPYLCDLENVCLAQGRFPACWKEAELIIIIKNIDKDKTLPNNYRPICLINALGKILEKLLCKRLNELCQLRGISGCQYGFRKGCSTEDAINRVFQSTKGSNRKYVLAIAIDITGAFDNL